MADPTDSSLAFFSKATPDQWTYLLSIYKDVLQLKADQRSSKKGGPEELIKLDTWFSEQLPKLIHSRKDPHIIHEELVQIAKWKLMRGKFRPRLLDLVRINTETAVLTITKKAFRKLYHQKNLSQAINALVTLKGIGPATASAVLSAAYPEHAPFMSDECMLSTPGVEATDSTLAEYTNYSEQIKNCSERLKAGDPDGKWTPHKVDQALWTHYLARELKPELLDGMPSGNEKHNIKSDEENDSNDRSVITSTITSTTIATNGKTVVNSVSDESSSGPSSEVEDKSNDSLLQNNNGNGNMNGEDSKDFGSECIESEDSRIIASEENSIDDNAVDSSIEPAFKKQRVEALTATDLSAVAVGEDAQL